MSLFRINRTLPPRILTKTKCFSTIAAKEDDEYTGTPQYPPILDLSFKKSLERKKAAVYEEIKNVRTVEEKQLKINMPRYYGFKTYMFLENQAPYNSLLLTQHATRTHLIKTKDLPEYYKDFEIENLEQISKDIQESMLVEVDGYQKWHSLKNDNLTDVQKEDIISSRIARQIHRVLNYSLSQKCPHFFNNEVDLEPRIESAWYVGGMNPPERLKSYRRGMPWMKKYENDPADRLIYYEGSPSLTVRSELPLPTIVSRSEGENPALDVPCFQFDPRVLGTNCDYKHMANIPGFWPGDSHTFGLISFLKRGYMLDRSKHIQDTNDNLDALHRQGILASYAWLHSQANFLGFTTFNDITYPLVTQTVITNGKDFTFYIYQLNTILLHSDNVKENPKRNICWASDNFKLYEGVEDGKIVGFNDEALKVLIKVYSNVPEERLGINLRPYLSQQEKLAADYEDDDKRQWLEREYKYLMSNRPRFKEVDEIYNWEKIYKVDNETRFMDKRTRFFELFKDPFRRRLDDRLPEYVPRALRPDLPRHKGRYKKEYWP